MGKSKRAKKKEAKKRSEDMDKMNGEVKQKVYKHHKEQNLLKVDQNKEIFDKSHNESEKFKKLCSHDELKGAILEEDFMFTKFRFDESSISKELYNSNENKRVEDFYNIDLNTQSNLIKHQVYEKDKESDQIKLSQGFEMLEEDGEYDFETFIPQ